MSPRATWAHLESDPCASVRLAFDTTASGEARSRLVDHLTAAGVALETVEDAEVVLGELVANGIEHGRPGDEGALDVAWCVYDDHVVVSVRDGGHLETELRSRALDPDSSRGRGLAMVDLVCDSWSLDTDDGVRVTARISRAQLAVG